MARVEHLGALPERGFRHVLTRALDRHHLRAARRDLRDLRVGRGLRHEDPAGEAGGRRVGGERGPRVAGRVLQHPGDAAAPEIADHHGHAAVLERAGRHHELELVAHRRVVPSPVDERGPALAEAHRVLDAHREGPRVAPYRAPPRLDVAAGEARARGQVQVVAVVGAPARVVERVGPAGGGIDVVHGQSAASSAVRARTRVHRKRSASSTCTSW